MKIRIILAVLIVSLLSVFPVSASSTDYVVDKADILSNDNESQLESMISETAEECGVGIYILTVEDYGGGNIDAFAKSYFNDNSLGYGKSNKGALLVLSMSQRDYAYYTNSAKCKNISDDFLSYFSYGDYYYGFEEYANSVRNSVKSSASNVVKAVLIGIAIGIIAALITVFAMKSKLKTVKAVNSAKNYVRKNSLNLTNSKDIYLYSNVVAVPRNTQSSSSGRGGSSFGGGRISSGSHGKF